MDAYLSTRTITTLTAISAAALYVYRKTSKRSGLPYPPGPRGIFLVGNLLDMPLTYTWEVFTEWGRKYGSLTYLSIAGQPVVVVNSHKAALDLLEKRAATYSDRPRFVMAVELGGFDGASVLLPYGPDHREHRKYLTQALHPRIVQKDFVPLQECMSRRHILALINDPKRIAYHVFRLTGEIMQTITYGAFKDGDLDLVELGQEDVRIFGQIIQGYAVDLLPWMKYIPDWFPGATFKREAKALKKIVLDARWLTFNMVKRKKAAGDLQLPSFVLNILNNAGIEKELGPEEEGWVSGAAATLFGGGSDTMASTILSFIMAMALNPIVQAKAHAELDGVTGNRLPGHTDKDSTPYLNAVIKETLRWHPAGPVGVPHRAMEDDTYDGYFIPAGSIIMVNVWGILHDERYFPNPMVFDPERWLSEEPANDTTGPIDPWTVGFGFGRRICPGIPLAQAELWIVFATILSTLEIGPAVDEQTGEAVPLKPKWSGGSISIPLPFECDIKPRSKAAMDRLRERADEAPFLA